MKVKVLLMDLQCIIVYPLGRTVTILHHWRFIRRTVTSFHHWRSITRTVTLFHHWRSIRRTVTLFHHWRSIRRTVTFLYHWRSIRSTVCQETIRNGSARRPGVSASTLYVSRNSHWRITNARMSTRMLIGIRMHEQAHFHALPHVVWR